MLYKFYMIGSSNLFLASVHEFVLLEKHLGSKSYFSIIINGIIAITFRENSHHFGLIYLLHEIKTYERIVFTATPYALWTPSSIDSILNCYVAGFHTRNDSIYLVATSASSSTCAVLFLFLIRAKQQTKPLLHPTNLKGSYLKLV